MGDAPDLDSAEADSGPTADALLDRLERIRGKSRALREEGRGVYRHPDYVPPGPVLEPPDIPEDRRWWNR